MSIFAINILLAFAWLLVTGRYTGANLLIGFILGYAVLAALTGLHGNRRYHLRLWRVLVLVCFFHYELVTSSLRVMWDIITPRHRSRPGFIAMPLDAKTDAEIFFTANLISLTPGTLSIAVSDDRSK